MAGKPKPDKRTIAVNPVTTQCHAKSDWFVQPPSPPKYQRRCGSNVVETYVCGAEYLPKLKEALEGARKSIYIAIWGFHPALPLEISDPSQREFKNVFGEILRKLGKEGIEVKLLVFSDHMVNVFESTLIGKDYKDFFDSGFFGNHSYERQWTLDAAFGRMKNVQLLTRNGPDNKSPYKQKELKKELEQARKSPDYISGKKRLKKVSRYNRVTFTKEERLALRKVGDLEYRVASGTEHFDEVDRHREKKGWAKTSQFGMNATATDHQKMILIDHELPEHALGFVQGFNFLPQYFDKPEHLYKDSERLDLKKEPIQDIGLKLTGSCLVDLFHNFKEAWNDSIGWADYFYNDKITSSVPDSVALKRTGKTAQILRTWKKTGEFTIEKYHKKSLSRVTEFIYVEDQYFRYPEFAEIIVEQAKAIKAGGSDKKIHLFVVTNAFGDSPKEEPVSRKNMVTELKRSDVAVNDKQWKKQQASLESDEVLPKKIIKEMEDANIKVHLAVLKTSEIAATTYSTFELTDEIIGYQLPYGGFQTIPEYASRTVTHTNTGYENIYVHSKLAMIDDAYFLELPDSYEDLLLV